MQNITVYINEYKPTVVLSSVNDEVRYTIGGTSTELI